MHEFQGVSISTHGASEYAQGRALPLRAIITIRTRTSCETCSQRERMEILVCDWHGWVYFARSKCTHHHKPKTTDVETRIDQVTSSLVGAQSLQLSSFSCPTECADHQPKCTLHHILCADSMNEFHAKEHLPLGMPLPRTENPWRPRMFHSPDRHPNPTCQAHGGPSLAHPRPGGPLISWPVSSRGFLTLF